MKVINKKRAEGYAKLFPDYIQKEIKSEEKDWKEQIFRQLKKAIVEIRLQ